jgi:acetoin:2,6-dichlorophenolindophenol oxidoreductase subunit alpha
MSANLHQAPASSDVGLPDRETILDLYRRMVRIRRFESAAGELMESGRLPGFLHMYVGEEAVAAGVTSVLRTDDVITSTHRGHGHAIAKGADFNRMFAELFGRVDGYCRGRGGSMHVNDPSIGMLGANGVVGAGIPIAVGAGFASAYRGASVVAVSFFGDGASNIGAFHEAANMAAVLNLPVVLVCENNGYAEYTPQSEHMVPADVADRGAAYGMAAEICDGMNVFAVREAAQRAVDRARARAGPTLLEAKTYRYYDHQGVKGLRIPYRTEEEVESWKARDPIMLLERLAAEIVTPDELAAVHAETEAAIEKAIAFAEASPEPDTESMAEYVYDD